MKKLLAVAGALALACSFAWAAGPSPSSIQVDRGAIANGQPGTICVDVASSKCIPIGTVTPDNAFKVDTSKLAPSATIDATQAANNSFMQSGATTAIDVATNLKATFNLVQFDKLACTSSSHDDGPAFRAMIAAMAATNTAGQKGQLPGGNCYIKSLDPNTTYGNVGAVIPKNVILTGNGPGGTALIPGMAMQDMLVLSGHLTGVQDIQFANASSYAGGAIQINKADNAVWTFVRHNYFSGFNNAAVHIEHGDWELIEQNTFISNGRAIANNNDGVNAVIRDNLSEGGCGILFGSTAANTQGSEGAIVENNTIFANGSQCEAINVAAGLNLRLLNNTFESSSVTARFAAGQNTGINQSVNDIISIGNWYGGAQSANQGQATGSITGAVLTVTTTPTGGTFQPGQVLYFAGAPSTTVVPISSQISGASSIATTASASTSTNQVTVASVTGIAVNNVLTGAGVQANTYVTAISGNTITLNQVAAIANGAALNFFVPGGQGTYALGYNAPSPISSTTISAMTDVINLRGTRHFVSMGDTINGRSNIGLNMFANATNPNSNTVISALQFYLSLPSYLDLGMSYSLGVSISSPVMTGTQTLVEGAAVVGTISSGTFSNTPTKAGGLKYGLQAYTPTPLVSDSNPLTIVQNNTSPILAGGSVVNVQNSATSGDNVFSPVLPPGSFENDGIRSTMTIPSGSPTGQTTAFSYYGINNSAASQLVGQWGIIKCLATGARCWDTNPTITDTLDNTQAHSFASSLAGMELDVSIYNPGSNICGICLTGSTNVQPAGGDGFAVGALAAARAGPAASAATNDPTLPRWTHGLVVNDATSQIGALIGTLGSGTAASKSQPVYFNYKTGSGEYAAQIQAGANGGLEFSGTNAANGITITPSIAGSYPVISTFGTDANPNMVLSTKDPAGQIQAVRQLNASAGFLTTNAKLSSVTVATLPACTSASEGTFAYVTDATALTYGGAPAGGGNIGTTVLCSRSGATPAYAWSMH